MDRRGRPFVFLLLLCVLGVGCVIRLTKSDDDPAENGDVTGGSLDCSKVTPTPRGAPAGAAEARFIGRFVDPTPDNYRAFQWSGTAANVRFNATSIAAKLRLPVVNDYLPLIETPSRLVPLASVSFDVIVDNLPPVTLQVKPGDTQVTLAQNLDPGRAHEVTLVRAVEALAGTFEFGGFVLPQGGQILPPIVRPRRIEVIGDSITCGYGILGNNASCRFSYPTEDIATTYSYLTARTLDAEVTTYCWSGRGVFRNNTGDNEGLIGELYPRTLASDPLPEWDFSKQAIPDAVVMLLGTNDFFVGIPDKLGFENAYAKLVVRVRANYPNAHVFIALPPMLSDNAADLPRSAAREMLTELVNAFIAKGDKHIYYMEFLDQGVRNGMGCDFHPNRETHQIMSDQLTGAIRTKTCW